MSWRNWSGAVEAHPAVIERPQNVEALCELVRQTAARRGILRVVGAGHSFTPLAACEDVMVSLDALSGVASVDPTTHEVWVQSGTRLATVSKALAVQGFALENMGDINVQSLAGAVSTGTHGTGVTLGNISSQATALELLTASGELRVLTLESDPELFRAAQVSLGALGILTRIRLRVLPAYKLRCVKHRWDLEETLARAETLCGEHRHFELFWFPYSDQVLAKTLDVTEEPAEAGGVARWLDEVVLENGAFWTVNQVARLLPSLAPAMSRLSAQVAGGGEARVDCCERVFASPRYVRFQEMEYGLPRERGAECLREIREWIRAKRVPVAFPIEYRFVKADELWLSPSFQRETAYIAVHMFKGVPYREYFEGVEAIFRNHAGRPHWGKMHTRTSAELATLYPRHRDFCELRDALDPEGLFHSPYLQTLFPSEKRA